VGVESWNLGVVEYGVGSRRRISYVVGESRPFDVEGVSRLCAWVVDRVEVDLSDLLVDYCLQPRSLFS